VIVFVPNDSIYSLISLFCLPLAIPAPVWTFRIWS